MKRIAFIGHRNIFSDDVPKRLYKAVEAEIQGGCRSFTMGTHGKFDELALKVCRELRKVYSDIVIEVVITGLNSVDYYDDLDCPSPYSDVKTVMFDIEQVYYKRRITESNRRMIDECDMLICYVDNRVYRSGAKTAMNYAKKKGLSVVNLYREEDRPNGEILKKEIDERWEAIFRTNINKK